MNDHCKGEPKHRSIKKKSRFKWKLLKGNFFCWYLEEQPYFNIMIKKLLKTIIASFHYETIWTNIENFNLSQYSRINKENFLWWLTTYMWNVFVIQRMKYNWLCNFINGPMNEQLNNIISIKNAVFFLYCRQTMEFKIFLVLSVVVSAGSNNGSCKDMLQGYLTGQLSSALGAYQVEALRRESLKWSKRKTSCWYAIDSR